MADAYVVQFPHPGGEHSPGALDRQPWNAGAHRRKFLRSPGWYFDAAGAPGQEILNFWGEWEPPSRVVERWPANGRLPRYLHEPVWGHPTTTDVRQNTDPWVFGECFRYSNCRQHTPSRRPSAMQRLTTGSLILFGSTLDGAFVLDTALVVAEATPFAFGEAAALDVDEAFRTCTLDSLRHVIADHHQLTLFKGATIDAPVHGMYSFVPCRLGEGPNGRFARPQIVLPGFINAASRQAASGAKRPVAVATVAEQWAHVRDQVLNAGCLLGVSFPTPPDDDGPTGV